MGRRSLAETRREAILAAFERCIARDGIDVPLERIADEAGVQRSLIRHYLGNRDDLVDQVITRIVAVYPVRIEELFTAALERGATGVLDFFFDAEVPANAWDRVIQAVLDTAPERYPRSKQRLVAMTVALTEGFAAGLARISPAATTDARYATAYSLFCLAITHDSMLALGVDPCHTAMVRSSGELLLLALLATAAS